MYPDFSIGSLTFHTFGLMMALGFVAASFVVYFELKRKGQNAESVYWIAIAAAVGGIVGSKLHYLLLHLDDLKQDPLASALSGAGLVWYGGFLGGLAAAIIVIRLYRLPWGKAFDAGAPGLALGYAFGRMGCFLNGDDYGKPSDLPWAMEFRDGSPPTPHGVKVQPTQLYESLSSLLIFVVLMLVRKKLKRDWALATLYIALAGLERFLVEFVRANRTGQSQQQILALVTALVAGGAFIWIQVRSSPEPRHR